MSSLGPKKPPLGSGDEDSSGGAPRPVTVASTGTVELPMLTKSNYNDWSLVMKVSLEALGLWEAVEADKADHREDRLALIAILRAVPVDMKVSLAVKKTAKEAWATVKVMRMGDTCVKDANAQRLLKQFENIVAMDEESIEDLATRVTGLTSNLQELGEKMEDRRIVRKLLRVIPKRYNQVACAIEMFSDLNTLSVEELIGKLRAAKDRVADEEAVEASAGVGRLMLTEEQWEARRRSGKERARNGVARHGGHGSSEKGGGCNSGHGEDDDDTNSTCSDASRRSCRYRGRCFDCGERGHMARNCPRKKKEKALLADVEEEYALL
jgi:hypothetical protein